MTEPTSYVAFERSEAEIFFRRYNDMDEALEFAIRDLEKMRDKKIANPQQFARETLQALSAYLLGPK